MNTSTSGGDVTTATTAEERARSSDAWLPAPTAAVKVALPGLYPNCFAVTVCSPTTTANVVLAITASPSNWTSAFGGVTDSFSVVTVVFCASSNMATTRGEIC